MKNKAFTLIELLVTIAIISLLSSIVFASMSSAKAKAQDSKMKSEAREVKTAVELYKADKGVAPYGNIVKGLNASISQTYLETEPEYQTAMNELVTGGYISAIPESPSGTDYAYIVSSDGTQSVFAANLNNPNSNSSSSSCELIANNPQPDLSYLITCDYVPPEILSGCYAPNPEEPNATSGCYNRVLEPGAYFSCKLPDSEIAICEVQTVGVFEEGCDVVNADPATDCVEPITYEEYVCSPVVSDPVFGDIPICDGATSTDYCVCN